MYSESQKSSLGANLMYYRKLAGFTQQQMSEMLNIHRTTYTKYETGDSEPSVGNLKRIAELLKVDIATLFEGNEDLTPFADSEEELPLDAEQRNVLRKYNALSREDREEVNKLLNELNMKI